jgi:hypothetical protein
VTAEELQEKLGFWVRTLRLRDWDIRAEIVSRADLKENDCGGCVEWMHAKKVAEIQILEAADYRDGFRNGRALDQELTLVHELLHLIIGTFSRPENETKEWELLEQAIHAISLGLIELERKHADLTPAG